MNSNFKFTFVFSAAMLAATSLADGWVLFDGETDWHVSGGMVLDCGVKTRLTTNQRQTYVTPFVSGDTAAEAKAKAEGVNDSSGTRKHYPNGAWIDMNDPGIQGEMPGCTGYYNFPGAPGENNLGSVFSLGSAHFSEVSTFGANAGSESHYDKDDEVVPGIGFELSRGLYRDDARHFGVDLGFGAQFFRRRNVYRNDSSWNSGSSVYEGDYSASIDAGDVYAGNDPDEDWNWRQDARGNYVSYGSGEPSADGTIGYAGPINGGAVKLGLTDGWRHDSAYGSMNSKADYENLEFLFLAHPYYDLTDWCRLVGTIGFVVSRQELEFSAAMNRDGQSSHYKRSFHAWDVYGVAGLGVQFRYRNFTLGLDVIGRFGDDDLDVKDRYVEGSVDRGSCFGRLAFGYSF